MDLQEALKFIPKGYSIKRCNWKDIYISANSENNSFPTDKGNKVTLSNEDEKADDWIVRWG